MVLHFVLMYQPMKLASWYANIKPNNVFLLNH